MLGKREELWTRTVSKVASGKRAVSNGGEEQQLQDSTGRQARRAPDVDRVPERLARRDRCNGGFFAFFSFRVRLLSRLFLAFLVELEPFSIIWKSEIEIKLVSLNFYTYL